MYSREISGTTYTFEASGGLFHASLVMRDRETDSWWSILTNEAIHGPADGETLRPLPGAVKTTFGDWRTRHPDTLVLSVDGAEHRPDSPYDEYFESADGFRDIATTDDRLADKAHVFTFRWKDRPHAVPHAAFDDGGALLDLDDRHQVFLYRRGDDSHYRGTTAFIVPASRRLVRDGDRWELRSGDGRSVTFDPETRRFDAPVSILRPLSGFDTFWYIWSLTNPETELLGASAFRALREADPG